MTKLNKDGLVPGQPVSFAEMVKANASRKPVAPAPEPTTSEAISTMNRADVVELLAANGVPGAKGKLNDLRDELVAIMFFDG